MRSCDSFDSIDLEMMPCKTTYGLGEDGRYRFACVWLCYNKYHDSLR